MKCLISQIQFKKEFLDIETVLIKEEIFDSSNVDVKIEKELVKNVAETDGWSDDDFFTLENPDDLESCIKSLINQVDDNEEEYFELITVIDDDEIDEEVPSEVQNEVSITENKETVQEDDFHYDKDSSTDSEPDLFGFDENIEVEEPSAIQKRVYRQRIPPNPDLEYRREQYRLVTIAYKEKKLMEKEKKLMEKEQKICHICGKVFQKMKSLEYHLNYHNGKLNKILF